MAPLDPFSAEIVRAVRAMSDNAILALVKNQLGNVPGAAAAAAAGGRRRGRPSSLEASAPASASGGAKSGAKAGRGRPGRKPGRKPAVVKEAGKARGKPGPKPKAAKAKRAGGRTSAGREELLTTIERVVKGGSGLSASEIAKSAGVKQTRVTSALKALKLAKRIYQGGDRRFARYAGDARSAEQASLAARQNASGPLLKKGKRK